MGTRHFLAVVRDGEPRIAQYGQWDGNPRNSGNDFIRSIEKLGLQKIHAIVDKCRFVTEDEIKKVLAKVAPGREDGFISMEQSVAFTRIYPFLDRDICGEILTRISSKLDENPEHPIELQNDYEFGRESLLCEWAYVLDLDTNMIEIYRGFNTTAAPVNERFSSDYVYDSGTAKYYPIRFLKSYPISELPTAEDLKKLENDVYEWEDRK